ncbi:MAG: hypothetical protein ABIB47_04995 [Candidatus Woesearchaeota archaeon]
MPLIDFSLPVKLPKELKKEISKLRKIKAKKKVILESLNFIKKNFESNSLLLFLKLHRHYYKDLSSILKKRGFFPCHILAFILRVLLIESGRFKEEDIKVHYTFYSGIIHEYLKVFVKNNWVNVDPWAYNQGVPFGKFGMGPVIDWFRFKKRI